VKIGGFVRLFIKNNNQTRGEMAKVKMSSVSFRLRFLWISFIAILAHIGLTSADYGKFSSTKTPGRSVSNCVCLNSAGGCVLPHHIFIFRMIRFFSFFFFSIVLLSPSAV
jgi:hypothetical protein